MNAQSRGFLALGSMAAALAVLMGAFGAHALRAKLDPAMLSVYHTAVTYHFYHALGLAIVGFTCEKVPASRLVRLAGWLMLAGIVLFSGSLYVLSLGGMGALGAITPFGGLAFIVSWVLLAAGVIRASRT
jgi:uncharacterized membrane protein YgdD (TMEM256/DUF423 family)